MAEYLTVHVSGMKESKIPPKMTECLMFKMGLTVCSVMVTVVALVMRTCTSS